MMALGGLTDELQALSFSEPEHLLFNPTGDKAWLRGKFDDIPRYLFRASTPRSDGTTDRFWVKSKDARYDSANSRVDIFARDDNQQVAIMLNRHFRWWGKDLDPDNLVSWTSSLLFALQYIFYRHTDSRDRSRLDEIYLYVVDTAAFAKGVFLRDIDLIHAYRSFDSQLRDLDRLRGKKHRVFKGSFYFGEYLSQGALKIEDKCHIVSAQEMINQGLFRLRPELKESMVAENPILANEVIRLRERFYKKTVEPQEITPEEIRAAIDIVQLFGPRWRLPVAANLIALLPRRNDDSAILEAFTATPSTGPSLLPVAEPRSMFTEDMREECSPSKTKVMSYDSLPEAQQFDDIMRSVYKDLCFWKLKSKCQWSGCCFLRASANGYACVGYLGEAEARLRCAIIHVNNLGLEVEDSTWSSGQALPLMDARNTAVLQRLDTIVYLSHILQQAISPGYTREGHVYGNSS